MRRLITGGLVAGLVTAFTLGSAVLFGRLPGEPSTPAAAAQNLVSDADIGALQQRLRERPRDAAGWAALGLAYVEKARVTADPSYYPRAEEALRRAQKEAPGGNDAALAGFGALAAARHDFALAMRYADQALAVNSYNERALAVRIDALVELGRLADALTAARQADSVRPGIPVFTRLAYVQELRGEAAEARRVLELARDSATARPDIDYIAVQLGELAWNDGDLARASAEFDEALRVSPDSIPALDGRARVRAARGDVAGALRDRAAIAGRLPLPSYLTSYGELLEASGNPEQARGQYAVARTWAKLAQANGVNADLETALFEAEHGDKKVGLRAAQAEWDRRCGKSATCSLHVADALAWALHLNGQDEEALRYARRATSTGYRNAMFRYHRGMIEKSLGLRSDARRSLTESLRENPAFSPLHAPRAREALNGLGAK